MAQTPRALRILLVEDNPDDVDLTLAAFRESATVDHHIDVVENGVEALAYLRRSAPYVDATPPDLVLLDLNLPKKTGHEVLATLRSDPTLHTLPVIVFTSSSAPNDVERAYAAGANGYVVKPTGIDELFRVVRGIDLFWGEVALLPSALREDVA